MKVLVFKSAVLFAVAWMSAAFISQAQAQAPAVGSQQVLATSAEQGKFTFIVFYRDDNDVTRAMANAVNESVAKRTDRAVATFVQITNPAEQAIVKQFDVSRAPMPMTLVTAPNGAITGVFPQKVADEQMATAFVTPAMTHCMKGMQDGKLVFLCVQSTPQPTVPQAVNEFLADPQFKDRTKVVLVQAADPAEAQLLGELEVGAAANQASTVFFAPPGVLVGKFGAVSTKAEIATALHKAGKCCEDPNCKHGHNHAAKPAGGNRAR